MNTIHMNSTTTNAIDLERACLILALPPEVVTALAYSGLIEEYWETCPDTYSLDDVIRVASLINARRELHREVICEIHREDVHTILESVGGHGRLDPQTLEELNAIRSEFSSRSRESR